MAQLMRLGLQVTGMHDTPPPEAKLHSLHVVHDHSVLRKIQIAWRIKELSALISVTHTKHNAQ